MRIAISSRHYTPILGGTIRYAECLATAFTNLGHEVQLITRTPGADQAEPFQVTRRPTLSKKFLVARWCDVLLQVEPSLSDALPFITQRKLWFPTLHVGFSRPGMKLRDRLIQNIQRLAISAGHPIGVSQFVLQSWKLTGSAIPNGYDETVFRSPPVGAQRDVDILFAGRITKDKGVFDLLHAVGCVSFQNRALKLVFAGAGESLHELKQLCKALPHNMEVIFSGSLASHEVAAWMRRSKVLVLPTTKFWIETSGLVLLEALASGCRIVGTDNGGISENCSGFGHIVPMDNPVALRHAIDIELRRVGHPTPHLERFLAGRTWPEVATRYIDIMSEFANN